MTKHQQRAGSRHILQRTSVQPPSPPGMSLGRQPSPDTPRQSRALTEQWRAMMRLTAGAGEPPAKSCTEADRARYEDRGPSRLREEPSREPPPHHRHRGPVVSTLAVLLTPGAAHAAPGDTIALPVRDALTALAVQDEDRTGYERTKFRHWTDVDRDGCHTRSEVLLEEAVTAPEQGPNCALTGGPWYSPYDDTYFTQARPLDIDHLGPACRSTGLRRLSLDRRRTPGVRQRPRRRPHADRGVRSQQPVQGRPAQILWGSEAVVVVWTSGLCRSATDNCALTSATAVVPSLAGVSLVPTE